MAAKSTARLRPPVVPPPERPVPAVTAAVGFQLPAEGAERLRGPGGGGQGCRRRAGGGERGRTALPIRVSDRAPRRPAACGPRHGRARAPHRAHPGVQPHERVVHPVALVCAATGWMVEDDRYPTRRSGSMPAATSTSRRRRSRRASRCARPDPRSLLEAWHLRAWIAGPGCHGVQYCHQGVVMPSGLWRAMCAAICFRRSAIVSGPCQQCPLPSP